MKEVDIAEFKRKCSALLEEVRKTNITLRVTRPGKPLSEIKPVMPERPRDWIGSMKESRILGDIISPAAPESDWEVLRDEPEPTLPPKRSKRRR